MREAPDPLRSGPQLHAWRTGDWLAAEDLTGPLVVFIHGLAASSISVAKLAAHVSRTFPVAVFDYLSHEGIDRGADDLSRRLDRFSSRLATARFAIIGHSMGGLVARQFARHATERLRAALSGLATLGTPHGGARSRRWLAFLLDLVERDELPNPFARSLACPATRQLLGADSQALVTALLEADRSDPLKMPVLTLSGGLNYIELFEPGTRWNGIANRFIQANLTLPNDGLVEESSADITRCFDMAPDWARHRNDYGAWSSTNHTHLVSNQDVGDLLMDWLTQEVFRHGVH
jgi:pimeloyl-ACP methyl ester carboxylesterase